MESVMEVPPSARTNSPGTSLQAAVYADAADHGVYPAAGVLVDDLACAAQALPPDRRILREPRS